MTSNQTPIMQYYDSIYDILYKNVSVVNQFYEAEILTEYVIRGNAAVLKCSIPSFVSDFVKVEAWIDEEGTAITDSEDFGKDSINITPLSSIIPVTSTYPFRILISILQLCHSIT